MTGRAKWDPMRDDFNNSTYDEELNERGKLDHCRLYITNIPKGLNEDGLKAAFERYGTLQETFLSRDPQKKYAIIKFETSSEAKLAMMKMNRTEPLKLSISVAYKNKKSDRRENHQIDGNYNEYCRDDIASVSSRGRSVRKEINSNGSNIGEDNLQLDEMILTDGMDSNGLMDSSLDLKLESLKLEQLKLREEQLLCKHRILMIQQSELAEKRQMPQSTSANRCILPNGRIVVRNVTDRLLDRRDGDVTHMASASDSTENTLYSSKTKTRQSWQCCETNDSSTPSTCTLCSEEQTDLKDESELKSKVSKTYSSKIDDSKVTKTRKYVVETLSTRTGGTSKGTDMKRDESDSKCELMKCSDFNADSDNEDETNRLIQLRNVDYMHIVEDNLKLVIVLVGYPKLKMRLRQMQQFQKCLTEVIDMQLKNNLLRKVPILLDSYLNRGAIVCICKDDDTRDWIVRILPGLQERMANDLVLLKAKVKRLCMAVLKIPRSNWPATAEETFKLLQYFNPTLNTKLWKIYTHKVVDDVECTYFLIDRISSEIIRGPMFKNVIDYAQMEFELTGYTEIYYEYLLESMQEDLRSIASRVKLLKEIKSVQSSSRTLFDDSNKKTQEITEDEKKVSTDDDNHDYEYMTTVVKDDVVGEVDAKKEMESSLRCHHILKELKDVQYISDKDKVLVWTDKMKTFTSCYEINKAGRVECEDNYTVDENQQLTSTSEIILSNNTPVTESLQEESNNNGEENKRLTSTSEITLSNNTPVAESLPEESNNTVEENKQLTSSSAITISINTPVTESLQEESNNNSEENKRLTSTSAITLSSNTPVTESLADESNNVLLNSSNINIDNHRGIIYHRRTNYLHIESQLKVAATLEGYPENKLEKTHLRRLKYLFNEYLHKDTKMQRFTNLIVPKVLDVYLSNGAVIYVYDSIETRDYLTEIISKLRIRTSLKLVFRDMNSLVRYTRVVIRLPMERANVESEDLLRSLLSQYPNLKPNCWKRYYDIAGKQRREFGVDSESLEVIKNPNFNPNYEGDMLSFRIIDRQKRDVCFHDKLPVEEGTESKQGREAILKNMYISIDPEIVKTPLTRLRMNHYTDLIADDLKLYVGPSNYPETCIGEVLFCKIKNTFENFLCECVGNEDFDKENIPKFYDMYLFDGVIFVIGKDMFSRLWIEKNLPNVNEKLILQLKPTEFRGAVGIVSMILKTDKDTNEVFQILQKQNPRLRTKFWRKISVVKSETKLDVVLQIDKLSAQVITSPDFNEHVECNPVEFKLGHLQYLIKPKSSLEELNKAYVKKLGKKNKMQDENQIDNVNETNDNLNFDVERSIEEKNTHKIRNENPKGELTERDDNLNSHIERSIEVNDTNEIRNENSKRDLTEKDDNLNLGIENDQSNRSIEENGTKIIVCDDEQLKTNPYDLDPVITQPNTLPCLADQLPVNHQNRIKMKLKIPQNILPHHEDDLNIIFDLLEDKNPGLNTELWQIYCRKSTYPDNKGKFILFIDKHSMDIIQSKSFDPTIGGEYLRFYF